MSNSSDNITTRQTLMLAVGVGAVVANIYYIPPLLPILANEFSTSAPRIGPIAMLTQFGTAAGMLIFVQLSGIADRWHSNFSGLRRPAWLSSLAPMTRCY